MTAPSFATLPHSKPDPIFAIAGEARAAGPAAIDGTIGVFLDETGKTYLFSSVQQAVMDVAAGLSTRSYAYPKLLGLPEYRDAVHALLPVPAGKALASIATTGGTGAVALNLRLARLMDPEMTLILPVPAWANHPPLCRACGIATMEVAYFEDGRPSLAGIKEALLKTPGPVTVLLQVSCHNPAGLDLSPAQWLELRDLLVAREAAAILDLAYQGFGGKPEEDAAPIRLLSEAGILCLIAWSASKNHAIYSERTGLAAAIVPDEKTKAEVEAHYSTLTRGVHSAAATFGQSVVARTQSAYGDQWRKDMRGARETLAAKRTALKRAAPESLRAAMDGRGMFALLPLSPAQILTLKTEHKVFMTGDGRINIAGIPLSRMEELGEKLGKVTA